MSKVLVISERAWQEIKDKLGSGYVSNIRNDQIFLGGIILMKEKPKSMGQKFVDFIRDGGRHPNY